LAVVPAGFTTGFRGSKFVVPAGIISEKLKGDVVTSSCVRLKKHERAQLFHRDVPP
jgi:hypothetical protein